MKQTDNIITSVIVLAGALFVAGCSTLLIHDTLPKNAPKGYVEFYAAATNAWGVREGVQLVVPVYRTEGSKQTRLGRVGWEPGSGYNGLVRVRVACAPGTNRFILVPTTGPRAIQEEEINRRVIDVEVKDNMITPVRLTFLPISVESKGDKKWLNKIFYSVTPQQGTSAPYEIRGNYVRLGRDTLVLVTLVGRNKLKPTIFRREVCHFSLDMRIEDPVPE